MSSLTKVIHDGPRGRRANGTRKITWEQGVTGLGDINDEGISRSAISKCVRDHWAAREPSAHTIWTRVIRRSATRCRLITTVRRRLLDQFSTNAISIGVTHVIEPAPMFLNLNVRISSGLSRIPVQIG
jgi:hypothetical protein